MGYSGETRAGAKFEKCDVCSRFGAKKYEDDAGPNGLGRRMTKTRWMCDRCENKYRESIARRLTET